MDKVEQRKDFERQIVNMIIDDALKQGYVISIWNGGDDPEISKSNDKEAILENMFACDTETMCFWVSSVKPHFKAGWLHLVYGNSGYDVVSDFLSNNHMAGILANANKLADELESKSNVRA